MNLLRSEEYSIGWDDKNMNETLRILIVEDSKDDTALLIREIKKGGYDPMYLRVETASEMIESLNGQTWDLVIADYTLPGFNAPEALKILQDSGLDLSLIHISEPTRLGMIS